jgi:WD40 repeat protein
LPRTVNGAISNGDLKGTIMHSLLRVWVFGSLLSVHLGSASNEAHGQTHFRGRWGLYGSNNGWHDHDQQWSGGLAFSPDSKLLVRHDDSKLVVWQLDERREVATLEHEGWPRLCRFSPDSRSLLVAVDRNGRDADKAQVVLWDLETQKIVWRLERARGCHDAEFSRDGARVATSTFPVGRNDAQMNKVTVWNTATQEEVQRLNIDKRGERHRPQNATLDFSPDGKLLVTSSRVGATIWDTSNWQRVRMLTGSADTRMARFSPDGRQVFAACQGSSAKVPFGVRVWKVDTGKAVAMTSFDHAADEGCRCWFTLAPHGRALVTTARTFEQKTKRPRSYTMKLCDLTSGRETILQHCVGDRTPDWRWRAVAFSPDGSSFAMASWKPRPQIKLLDAKGWLPKETFDVTVPEDAKFAVPAWDSWAHGVLFSPDGHWLAAARQVPGSGEYETFLWELAKDTLAIHVDDSARDK